MMFALVTRVQNRRRPVSRRVQAIVVGLLLLLGGPTSARPNDPPPIDFNRDVRRLLSDRCFKCHGPDAPQRKAGLRLDTREGATSILPSGHAAIMPGDVSSHLLRRISPPPGEESERMPPVGSGKALNEEEVSVLRRWIDDGASYAQHWSLVAPERPDLPVVVQTGWAKNPIDLFALARMEAAGLSPSDPADPETLLRRVSLDLTGLPPSLAEQDAYLAADPKRRYEEEVERLFRSARHGEHMAKAWLDAARYGDTHGYHLDNVRSLWPWRDWVIHAFQSNMPFDQFTIRQLAGDLLPESSQADKVATGFNRCNPTTGEGGLIEEEYLAKYAFDRAETTATVWMGMTLQCARCHDHKYDAISTRDYYGLFAYFNSLDEQGSDENALAPPPSLQVVSAEDAARQNELDDQIAAAVLAKDASLPETDANQRAWEEGWRGRLRERWIDALPTSALSRGGATVRLGADHSIAFSGTHPPRDLYEIVFTTDLPRIEGLQIVALTDPETGGVGRADHRNIVLSEVQVDIAPRSNPLATVPVPLARAVADYHQRGFHAATTIDGDLATGWAIGGAVDRPHALYLAPERPFGYAGGTLVRIQIRQESGFEQHALARIAVSLTADPSAVPATISEWRSTPTMQSDDPRGAFLAATLAANARPTGSDRGGPAAAEALTWEERPDFIDERVHDLGTLAGLTYLERTISAGSARSMTFAVGSDDAIRVWLNGNVVLDRDVARSVAPDQDTFPAQLVEGENVLRMLIANYGGGAAFSFRVVGEYVDGLPPEVGRAILAGGVDDGSATSVSLAAAGTVRDFYRRAHSPEWAALDARVRDLTAARVAFNEQLPVTMISRERAERRTAHVLVRGEYDQKGEVVLPAVPAALPPMKEGAPANRLGLAQWLVDPTHPLTARVTVNRMWQQVFGLGLVKTVEDFGAQGEWPSHPELLDWLAIEFIESGWDQRHLLRLMVTSNTYRQSSVSSAALTACDPDNRLLSRGPRQRLDAEAIRDGALHSAGLLVERVGGPSVKPYQPPGIWLAVGYSGSNTVRFQRDDGDALYRRSLYTFWKRTAPPPVMSLFDAPSREACVVRRTLTNTPLQALALLNDEQQIEAARRFAERALTTAGSDRDRLEDAFRRATSRRPAEDELDVLVSLLEDQRAVFAASPDRARALLGVGTLAFSDHVPPAELAAWACVTSVLQNLSETIWKS